MPIPQFPQAVPEIPVSDIKSAAAYYVSALGFTLDWTEGEYGICGISQGDCRIFLTNPEFREDRDDDLTGGSVIWLNLSSKAEVDDLWRRWRDAGAKILEAPDDKPWKLREFLAADLDGNQFRVFYDFSRDL